MNRVENPFDKKVTQMNVLSNMLTALDSYEDWYCMHYYTDEETGESKNRIPQSGEEEFAKYDAVEELRRKFIEWGNKL